MTGDVVLNGGGHVTLTDSANNSIVGDGAAATLTNFDAIAGAGTIGDSHLVLLNSGIINANGSHPLIIDTGVIPARLTGPWAAVTNNAGGILEVPAGHTLQIDDNVLNNGLIEAGNSASNSAAVVTIAGNITGTRSIELFNHATVEIGGSVSSGQTVTFGTPGCR
jgi:large repetitive protein